MMMTLVFPTPVGVFLVVDMKSGFRRSLPHARGGVSRPVVHGQRLRASSPRPWGCFPLEGKQGKNPSVFPTPVGVFPRGRVLLAAPLRLPHARGGVSGGTVRPGKQRRSSPRPWGCFRGSNMEFCLSGVFPTPVGVFLSDTREPLNRRCLPHARGGVSGLGPGIVPVFKSSPRPWGCFSKAALSMINSPVFPTPVGVFP